MQVEEMSATSDDGGSGNYTESITLKQRDKNEEKFLDAAHSRFSTMYRIQKHIILKAWKISCVLICWYKDLKRNHLSALQVHNMNFMNSWFN